MKFWAWKRWISRAKDLLLESDLTKKQIYLSGEDRDTMLFYITVVVDFTHSSGYSLFTFNFHWWLYFLFNLRDLWLSLFRQSTRPGADPNPFFIRQLMLLFFSSYFFSKKCSYCHFTLAACEQAWHSRDRDLVNLLNCSFFAVLRNNSITRQARFLVSPVGYVVFARSLSHFTLSLPLFFYQSEKGHSQPSSCFLGTISRVPSIVISLHNDDHRR